MISWRREFTEPISVASVYVTTTWYTFFSLIRKGENWKKYVFIYGFSLLSQIQLNLDENLFRFLGKAFFLNTFYNLCKILPFLISKLCDCDVYTCHANSHTVEIFAFGDKKTWNAKSHLELSPWFVMI